MHPGRPVTKPPPGLDDLILKQFGAMPVGYTRMCEYLARAEFTETFGCKITSSMVSQLYDYYSLWSYRVIEDEPERPRCRYEASQVNLIWHTDLHLYRPSHRLMIAFLDDASRRVMGWSFLTDKKATSTRDVLRKTMEANHVKPYAIWSDNGAEFKGEFQSFLQEQDIRHVHTAPRNPQQNGKMERFWPTAEKCASWDGMDYCIKAYNRFPHQALGNFEQVDGTQAKMAPNDAYTRLEQWPSVRGPHWTIDGNERPFVLREDVRGEGAPLELE
jgi:hypothetical protein